MVSYNHALGLPVVHVDDVTAMEIEVFVRCQGRACHVL